MKRTALALLCAALIAMLACGCAEQQGFEKTENTGERADTHPYLVETESARRYAAKADIELLGEDAFFEGLYAMLADAKKDIRDAREALKGFIPDEIPAVDILTGFCGNDGMAETANAYYNGKGIVDVYGKDTVFNHWNIDPNAMETVFGKPFSELYREWTEWNAEQCRIMGIRF